MITPPVVGRFQAATIGFFLAAMFAGCEPKLDPERFGEVIYQVPQIQGAEEPYKLPQLEKPDNEAPEAEK